jgi:alpha-amylase
MSGVVMHGVVVLPARGLAGLALAATVLAGCAGSSPAPGPPLPPNTSGWWRDKTVYEVFVRSYADADGDGIGDLPGLTARLPALGRCPGAPAAGSLGVDALWLMPIFPSPSYHGYDVTDYGSINPVYGTLADFDALVAAAHACDLKIVLDMVLNHSSSLHPWFTDSASGPAASRRGWYVWSDTALSPGWSSPTGGGGPAWHSNNGAWYYGAFTSGMPDLNLANPAVEAELVAAMKSWLKRGVDGFRLDAVPYYVETGPGDGQRNTPPTHAFLKRIRAALQAEYPQALLVAEAWQSPTTVATYHGAGDEVQLAFTFDLAARLVGAAGSGVGGDLMNAIDDAEAALGGIDRGFQAPFLTNHDQVRVMRQLSGDAGAARVAAAALFALAGTPFVYYGEELGMQGGPAGDDRDKRTTFHWDDTLPSSGFTSGTPWYATSTTEAAGTDVATQRADPGSLWNLYRSLIALRRAQPPLHDVGFARLTALPATAVSPVALLRSAGGKRILFVANFATSPSGAFSVTVPSPAPAAGAPSLLLGEGLVMPWSLSSTTFSFIDLEPRGFAFLSLD